MRRYDDHASAEMRERILGEMAEKSVVLVSDAGTPLISDPGYRLVREARERGLAVTSLPGPSAMIVALTLAGLPTDRFLFAGFLPSRIRRAAMRWQGLPPFPPRWCSTRPARAWSPRSKPWRSICRAANWPWRAS
jgi:16S rRNA (cytidine(1402)-2'-O)-methyltransferase